MPVHALSRCDSHVLELSQMVFTRFDPYLELNSIKPQFDEPLKDISALRIRTVLDVAEWNVGSLVNHAVILSKATPRHLVYLSSLLRLDQYRDELRVLLLLDCFVVSSRKHRWSSESNVVDSSPLSRTEIVVEEQRVIVGACLVDNENTDGFYGGHPRAICVYYFCRSVPLEGFPTGGALENCHGRSEIKSSILSGFSVTVEVIVA